MVQIIHPVCARPRARQAEHAAAAISAAYGRSAAFLAHHLVARPVAFYYHSMEELAAARIAAVRALGASPHRLATWWQSLLGTIGATFGARAAAATAAMGRAAGCVVFNLVFQPLARLRALSTAVGGALGEQWRECVERLCVTPTGRLTAAANRLLAFLNVTIWLPASRCGGAVCTQWRAMSRCTAFVALPATSAVELLRICLADYRVRARASHQHSAHPI